MQKVMRCAGAGWGSGRWVAAEEESKQKILNVGEIETRNDTRPTGGYTVLT